MVMTMNYDEAIQLLKSLEISARDDSWDVMNRLEKTEYKRTVNVADGASKICLIPQDAPFVIKWSAGVNTTEAMDEVKIYQKAMEENLAMFFPKTAFLCKINDVNFVVQEKIDCSCGDLSFKKAEKYRSIAQTAKNSLVWKMQKEFHKASREYRRDVDTLWAKMALVIYGKRACMSLERFVIENAINDLHRSNIGFKNDKPIILDFSGYHR